MTTRSYLNAAAVILMAIAIAVSAAVVILPRLLNLDNYKTEILARAEKALGRRVSYQSATFSKDLIPSIVVRGITISEKSGNTLFLEAGSLSFKLALFPLLRNEVHLHEVVVDRPVVALYRDGSGALNIDDLLTAKRPSRFKIGLDSLTLKKARVVFIDHFSDAHGFTVCLENMEMAATGLGRGKTTRFRIATTIPNPGAPTAISLSGTARIPAEGKSPRDTRLDVKVEATNVDAWRYWPYYGRYVPFERPAGRVDVAGDFKGRLTQFTSNGTVKIRGLRFNYPAVFHALLSPRELRLAYQLALTPRDLDVQSVALDLDGLRVKGSCLLRDIHSDDLRITARATTSPFRLEEFGRYIPYGVIVPHTADFIERYIKGGIYRLDDGRLDGRISQITHMERGDNYNVLYIRGRVAKGIVSFPQVPAFHDIEGALELRGKDFLLSAMSGKFGASPFTLEGKIAGYPLKSPATYPFTMAVIPAKPEVAWLLRQNQRAGMEFSGQSLLRLSGAGTADDYRLAGSWDLSSAQYGYHETRKPAGIANKATFAARLRESEAELEELHYQLAALDARAVARYRYHERAPLVFSLRTSRFLVDPLVGLLPALRKYQPSGTMEARAEGSGNPTGSAGIGWQGEITLAGFSVRPVTQIKALHDVAGTIRLTQGALETDRLSGSVGNSPFLLKGQVAGFAKPGAEVEFSIPRLHPDDFGYQSAVAPPVLENVAGRVSLGDGKLRVASLSGQVKRTAFTMSGEVGGWPSPRISVDLYFPHLFVEDLTTLTQLRRRDAEEALLTSATVQARITAADGTFRDIPFQRLETQLSLEGKRLAVDWVQMGIFGGTVAGRGSADFVDEGASYQVHYGMTGVDAAKLQQAAGVKPYVTGELGAEGDLAMRGKTRAELTKSARVTSRVHLEKGELLRALPGQEKTAGNLHFPVLDATFSLNDQKMTVHAVKASIFAGTVSGSGEIEFAPDTLKKYQAHYRLERVDASQLQQAAGLSEHLSGKLTAEGALTAEGNNLPELQGSFAGFADIDVSGGSARLAAGDIPFKSLHSRLSLEKQVLRMQSMRAEAFGGVVAGTVKADFSTPDVPRYQLTCQMTGVNAKEFFDLFRVTKELSGTLALSADLTASGATVNAWEKTLQGWVGMHLKDGVINRYSILSKMFSILNVSQLFSFRLPNMVTAGMPYKRIDGNFSLRDGVATTNDLSLTSPSVNMTAVGKTDLVKREVDLAIGVESLQTIGKVVNRIPVVGWLLTGSKKTFLVTYFQAKGNWNDPKVTAVPVSSLSGGIYNVFKRIYHLPGQMMSEPGAVMMGK